MAIIHNLQALRAAAAALVVAHHLRGVLGHQWPSVHSIQIGAAGVDIFFVLSGVVIALSEARRRPDFKGFVMRRTFRVVPAYWAIITVTGLMLLAGLSPVGIHGADGTLLNWFKSMAFIPFERSHGPMMPLLGVGWTLNYEMFFYAMFALLIWVPKPSRSWVLVLAILFLVGGGQLVQPQNLLAQFYTNPILIEFAVGVLIAQWWINSSASDWDRWTGFGLLGLGAGIFILGAQPEYFEQLMPMRVIQFGVPATMIVMGAMLCERSHAQLSGRVWATLGASSYAVYLSHSMVLQIVEKLAQAGGILLDSMGAVLAVALAGLVISHLAGLFLYVRFEKPVTKFLTRQVARQAQIKAVDRGEKIVLHPSCEKQPSFCSYR
ncbi:MAG: acyltransferase [Sulfitobacter sp.]